MNLPPSSTTPQTLLRCVCGYRLIVDEGTTFAIHMGHWRVNKTTGRVTARCPRCPVEHVVEEGESAGKVEGTGNTTLRSVVGGMMLAVVG